MDRVATKHADGTGILAKADRIEHQQGASAAHRAKQVEAECPAVHQLGPVRNRQRVALGQPAELPDDPTPDAIVSQQHVAHREYDGRARGGHSVRSSISGPPSRDSTTSSRVGNLKPETMLETSPFLSMWSTRMQL